MPTHDDRGHIDHAKHFGQKPIFRHHFGPQGIVVELRDWGPDNDHTFADVYHALMANWGEHPEVACVDIDSELGEKEWKILENAFAGNSLQNPLERFSFAFCIDGVSRACTHQLVRTRIGAAMMQHGGRDNDWRHRAHRHPETIRRLIEDFDEVTLSLGKEFHMPTEGTIGAHAGVAGEGKKTLHCLIENHPKAEGLYSLLVNHIQEGRNIYAALVDCGIPWQDARRYLQIGSETYIFIDYNWVALKGVLANRLEHIMDWEINCVAQLMHREINKQCPDIMGKHLGSHSDRRKEAAFAGLDSWPPDGKWPMDTHFAGERTHRREQMPFWVLTPDALAGGPVEWIGTNGSYPHVAIEEMTHAEDE